MNFFGGFNSHKLKSNLKMASQRITLVNNKMDNMVKRRKKEIAKMLEAGKVEKARIMVEHVIRDDFTMEAHELIELLCETVVARLPLLLAEKQCPFDMVNAVSTLIYCARRVQIPELTQIRKQLVKKYGKEFAQRAERNVDAVVNERIIHKLSIQPPNAFLVVNYLKEIAKQYGVNWVPKEPVKPMNAMPTPTGFSVQPGTASGFNNLYKPPDQGADPQYKPSTQTQADNVSTKVQDDPVGNMTPPQFDALDKNGDGVLSRDEFQGPPSDSQNLTIPTAQVYTPSGDQLVVPPAPGHDDSDVADEKILPTPPGNGDTSLPMPPGPTVNNVSAVDNTPPEPSVPSNNTSTDVPDFDDLQARFNALRGFK